MKLCKNIHLNKNEAVTAKSFLIFKPSFHSLSQLKQKNLSHGPKLKYFENSIQSIQEKDFLVKLPRSRQLVDVGEIIEDVVGEVVSNDNKNRGK